MSSEIFYSNSLLFLVTGLIYDLVILFTVLSTAPVLANSYCRPNALHYGMDSGLDTC